MTHRYRRKGSAITYETLGQAVTDREPRTPREDPIIHGPQGLPACRQPHQRPRGDALDHADDPPQANDVGTARLEVFEEDLDDDARNSLDPYAPRRLLLRGEFDELFDTTPDLTGADDPRSTV